MSTKNHKKIVATIGRWMPIHNGHKAFLTRLAKEFDKIVVMIGSAYEGESIRYCITATEREKMIRAIFKAEGIPEKKFVIIPMEDKPTFEEWLDNSFNQRDILDEKYDKLSVFIDNYENLVNNGVVIKKSDSFMYDVVPYDGEPYINFEDDAINNSNIFELKRK